MDGLAASVAEVIGSGATCIAVLLHSPGDALTELSREYPEMNSRFGRCLDVRDLTLLNFCRGICQASLVSHRLRAMGFRTTSFTGFKAFQSDPVDFGSVAQGRSHIDILKRHISNLDAVIVSGLQFIADDGSLRSPGEDDGERFLRSLALEHGLGIISLPESMDSERNGDVHRSGKGAGISIPEIPEFLRYAARKSLEKRKVITGVIIVTDLVEFFLDFRGERDSDKVRLELLSELACKKISLDMINICYDYLNFIVPGRRLFAVEDIVKKYHINFSIRPGLVKISLTGVAMKGMPGVMAKVYGALEEAGVDILRSTDSHITISCLIMEEDLPSAIEAVMSRFRLSVNDLIYEAK